MTTCIVIIHDSYHHMIAGAYNYMRLYCNCSSQSISRNDLTNTKLRKHTLTNTLFDEPTIPIILWICRWNANAFDRSSGQSVSMSLLVFSVDHLQHTLFTRHNVPCQPFLLGKLTSEHLRISGEEGVGAQHVGDFLPAASLLPALPLAPLSWFESGWVLNHSQWWDLVLACRWRMHD